MHFFPSSTAAGFILANPNMGSQDQNSKKDEKKLQTTVIRAQIHCQGCLKKLKKALLKIEGVETISVDSKDYKMTVVGKVDSKKVLKELQKTGKYVELVPPAKEEKKEGTEKKNQPQAQVQLQCIPQSELMYLDPEQNPNMCPFM